MDTQEAGAHMDEVLGEVSGAVIVDEEVLRTILVGFMTRGHVLLEDVPGTGKTLTARSVARALGLEFTRIQCTPDLLPTDITGTNVYDEQSGNFEFKPGPIFANVVLVDEINRASPKTQAALLEAMGEGQVSTDGESYPLPEPFFLIATQNPVERGQGTFPLPFAQKDRFLLKTSLGYPSETGERELLDRREARSQQNERAEQVLDVEAIDALRLVPEEITVHEDLKDYIVEAVRSSREDPRVEVGVSPRGCQQLFEAARGYACLAGRVFVTPDDIKTVAIEALAHRLVLTADATVDGQSGATVISDIFEALPVPGGRTRA
jgi:MoxR-like ATPase